MQTGATTVTVDEAQTKLRELVEAAARGEKIIITTQKGVTIQLVRVTRAQRKRLFGVDAEAIWMSDDFDAPLEDFAEYM